MIKTIKYALIVLLLFVLYVVGGALLSYLRQPPISAEYQDQFQPADVYSDDVSCERACIIENNEEALLQRLRMIAQAKEQIILSTFEFRADESGKDILSALLSAAERGVDIKVLSDGMTAFLHIKGNPYFQALASNENAEIKTYNRINLFAPWKTMGRLHDKYVIVDGNAYLLGGRNTYDYFLGDHGYRNYDRDALVYSENPEREESSVHQLEKYFASVWESKDCATFRARASKKVLAAKEELEDRYQKIQEENPALAESIDYEEMTFPVNRITLLSNPIHVYAKEPTLFYSLAKIMESSEGDIDIHTPYIICNDWMYGHFQEICKKNPRTRLLTNSVANNGNLFGASDYQKHKDRLLDTGLNIYEYEGGISYHGKCISIGDRLSIVGSFNMDMRSVYLDTELMLVIDSEQVNRQLRDNLQIYEKDCAKALDNGEYEVPEDVERQEVSPEKQRQIHLLQYFNWLRFLM